MSLFTAGTSALANKKFNLFSRQCSYFHNRQRKQKYHTAYEQDHSTHLSQNFSNSNKLPIVDALVNQALRKTKYKGKALPLAHTGIIYVQHSFATSLSVIDAFIALGADPRNITVVDKAYSRCAGEADMIKLRKVQYQPGSLPKLLGGFEYSAIRDYNAAFATFKNCLPRIEKIIAVSLGKNFLELLPPEISESHPIVAIEKTSSGLSSPVIQGLPFPVIGMANSAAKLILESPIIADEIIRKLIPVIPIAEHKLVFGVIGYGAIGKAITDKLLAMNHRVMVYDHDYSKLKKVQRARAVEGLNTLISNSDYIFGCTGQDITASIEAFNFCKDDKTLISASSGDVEFLSLLHLIQKKNNIKAIKNSLSDIEYINELDARIRILHGGFPVNFDNQSEAAPPEDIQLTRALSLASVLQAAKMLEQPHLIERGGIYKLRPALQRFIAGQFLSMQTSGRYPKDLFDKFNDLNWIEENSGGLNEPRIKEPRTSLTLSFN